MITPYVPTESRSTRCRQDMAREQDTFWLVICEDDEGKEFIPEHSLHRTEAGCLSDLMGGQYEGAGWWPSKVVRVTVGGSSADVSYPMADMWLAALYSDGDKSRPLPDFIDAHIPGSNDAFDQWREEPDEPSLADENRLCKAQMGLR